MGDVDFHESMRGLQVRKLLAETEKAESDAAKARLELARTERHERNELASPDESLVYLFNKKVDEESVEAAMTTIGSWARRAPKQQIQVQLNTVGGSVAHGLAFYDFLRLLSREGHRIETLALGQVQSMGASLLQAGDERVMSGSSFMMIHRSSYTRGGKSFEHEDMLLGEVKICENRMLEILSSRSKLSKAEVAALWDRKDTYFTPAQAKRLGLCDRVIRL